MASNKPSGIVKLNSQLNFADTALAIESAILENHLTIFAKVDHAAGAQKIGTELRPTILFIFGSPAGGTPIMQCNQLAAIDLPLKLLVFEDPQHATCIAYNQTSYLLNRHSIAEDCPTPNLDELFKQLIASTQIDCNEFFPKTSPN